MAPVARANDWGTSGLDAAHTRLSSERSGTLFTGGTWTASFPTGAQVLASPVVGDGFVVTTDLEGVVSVRRADSGALVWQVALRSMVHGTPALVRGRVFVPTSSGSLFALRLSDGTMLWKRDLGGITMSSPTPIDGDIVVAPGFPQTNVVRLSGETGEVVWQSPSVLWQFSNTSPAVGGGLVVVGSQSGRYYAFDAVTGAPRWQYVADGVVHLAAPLIFDGRVYMAGGGSSNHVHAVDAATGVAVPGWPIDLPTPAPDVAITRQGGSRAVSSFAAVGGLLLLQTRLDDVLGAREQGPYQWLLRETVVALNPSSGALVWQQALVRAETTNQNKVPLYFVCPTPAAYRTESGSPVVVVASSLDAVVAVLDVANGSEQARHAVAGPALASPVLANGRLYTTAFNGTIQALGSDVNRAPEAPAVAEYPDPIDVAHVTLDWSPAADIDGEAASYELRIDTDGEIFEGWQQQLFLDAGVTSARIAAQLVPGVTYSFSVRARDAHGALSPWSTVRSFTVIEATGPAGTTGAAGSGGCGETTDATGTAGDTGSTGAAGASGGAGGTGTGETTGGTGTGETTGGTGTGETTGPAVITSNEGTPRGAGGAPQLTVAEPPADGSPADVSSDRSIDHAVDEAGCSVSGRTGDGGAAGLLFAALVALRVRRRRTVSGRGAR